MEQKTASNSSGQDEAKTRAKAPRLLLHSCCAPCSSYVLEYLSDYFAITDFFYNPNIAPQEEYRYREEELKRLIREMHPKYEIAFVAGKYDPERFYETVRGLEHIREGGERCFACYRLRMEEAALLAAKGGYDYFTTTLTISPLKRLRHWGTRPEADSGRPESSEADRHFLPFPQREENQSADGIRLSTGHTPKIIQNKTNIGK